MPRILIVDDSPVDQHRVGKLLENPDYTIQLASDGKEALDLIAKDAPDLVLSDLMMPEMDGLELLQHIVAEHSAVPVIIMTAHGNEEIAVEALQQGAASYIAKRNMTQQIPRAVQSTLAASQRNRDFEQIKKWRSHLEERFVLDVDFQLEALVGHLQNCLREVHSCGDIEMYRAGTALNEALVNAMEHGNLELDSKLRESLNGSYPRLRRERQSQPPYRDRRLYVVTKHTREEATYVIRDEGPGFDPSSVPDPRDPANIERVSGRGLILIQTFMDKVTFNDQGNQITMVKRRAGCDA